MPAPIIEVNGLTKAFRTYKKEPGFKGAVKGLFRRRYEQTVAVNGVSFTVQPGELVGFLGPNGAGKTTTLRMLYGLLEPEEGVIRYGGKDFAPHRTELRRLIGVCTQDDTIDYDFTVEQNLRVYASYFRPKVEDLETRIQELLTRFGLKEYAHASPRTLSGGYKQRLLIARSVIHRPRILFLDEPTTGLDPRARVDVWELIDGMRTDGMAIVLTTHYMEEAERLSDELVVLSKGKAVARGTTASIVGGLLGEHIVVVAADQPRHEQMEAWARAQGLPVLTVLGELRLPVKADTLRAFTEAFGDAKFSVRAPSLDDLFLLLSEPAPSLEAP